VKALAGSLPEGTQTHVILFDTALHPVPAGSPSATSPLAELSAPPAIYAATSYGTAFTAARELCLRPGFTDCEVTLLTDLQRSGLDWSETESFPETVSVTIKDLGREILNNVAITTVLPEKVLLRPGEGTRVTVTVDNHGKFSLDEVPVLLNLAQGSRSILREEKLSMPPGQTAEVVFSIPSLKPGPWTGTIVVDYEDDLTFDNHASLALLSARQQQVLLVDGEVHPAAAIAESYFLERAISVARHGETSAASPFTVKLMHYGPGEHLPDLSEVDQVVLSNVGRLAEADARALAGFVEQGNGLLVITGDRMTPENCEPLQASGLAPGQIAGISRAGELPFRWDNWDAHSDLLSPFADPQAGDLQRLSFSAYTRIIPAAETRVLASFASHDPALTEHPHGQGQVLWFLSGCDPSWGNWNRSRLFLPLVHQMVGDLAHLTGGGPVQFHRLDEWETVCGASSDLPQPGVVSRQGRWQVFNINERESETDRCSPAELAERFHFVLNDAAGKEEQELRPAAAGTPLEARHDEIWPWCAGLLLGLLSLEWIVSNRTVA
jgi:hypothetical protein